MKSYLIIKALSESLYINLENKPDLKARLENQVDKLQYALSEDFESLFGRGLSLESYHIYLDDETYRQSATGLILHEAVVGHEAFKLLVECLIDPGRIWMKVVDGKEIPEFADLVRRIEHVQNAEGKSELSEIR